MSRSVTCSLLFIGKLLQRLTCPYSLRGHVWIRNILKRLVLFQTVTLPVDMLTYLSKWFQRSTLSQIEAHQLCLSKIRILEVLYLGENTIRNDKTKQILTENEDINTKRISQFIWSVWDHLHAKFSADELKCWSAFDPTAARNCPFDLEFGK